MPQRELAFLSGFARAQGASGIGLPYLWILSFSEAKESISPASARTGF